MAQIRVQRSPMYGQAQTQGPVPNGTGQKPSSRLEMLQAGYQKRLLKEKEEKLIKMYEDNQKRAMDKVKRHGSGASNTSSASNTSTYSNYSTRSNNVRYANRQMVREANNGKSVREYFMEQRGDVKNDVTNSPVGSGVERKPPFPTAAVKHQARPPQDMNAGRDKSRPLEPINRPTPPKQRADYDHNRYVDNDEPETPPIQMKPQLARRRKKSKDLENMNKQTESDADSNQEPKLEVDASIPDKVQLQRLRKQHQLKQATQQPAEKKLTDFQKWKMEQDAAKEKRLREFREKQRQDVHRYSDSEEEEVDTKDEEIRRKEQELLDRIRQQQQDLEKMRRERQEEDEREQKELELERRREEAAQRRRALLARTRRPSKDDTDGESSRGQPSVTPSYRAPPSQHSRYEYEESDDDHPPVKLAPRPPAKPSQPKPKRQPKKWVPPPTDDEPISSARRDSDSGVDFYAQAAMEAEKQQQLNLRPCNICGRKFNSDRLEKHRKVCAQSSKKSRKVFDMSQQRIVGTELQKYAHSKDKNDAYYTKKAKKSDWRKQHQNFIQSIQYAKQMSDYEAQGGNIADLPPPPPSENPDYVKCPYCERKFNPNTAERHIPRCKDIKARPAPPKGKKR